MVSILRMKRSLLFLLASAICMATLLIACKPAIARADAAESAPIAAQSTQHANLVVVVRFSGDTVGDDATGYNAAYQHNNSYTYWDQFRSWFGSTGIEYFDSGTTSLASYMGTISNGAYNMTSYFPQSSSDGHTLAYITLPHDQSYYENARDAGDLQVVEDAAGIFNANATWTSGSSSWGSNGALDNLELVVQVASEPDTSDTLLWPHKSNASGAVDYGGMKVNEYNFVNSKAVGDLGTVKHEYLHSVGLGDLYRVGDTSRAAGPVDIWDIMGTAAGQWPLAQSLVDLGFESADAIKTVSGAGTHSITLHTHYSTADDGQAVKVCSPYSADEYFVFEYRQKSTDILAPDRLVPSSGLIVYRVNDAVDRDVNGHRTNRNNENSYYEDAIYVFRPGDTGIHDSAGDLQKAALSTSAYAYLGDAANTRATLGSADLSLAAFANDGSGTTTSNDTIFDSQGRNTGIVVTVTAQTDDSITFDISIPDYSSLSLWDSVGTAAGAAQADCASTAVDSGGAIYESYIDSDDSSTIYVRKWDGSTWTSLGSAAGGLLSHAQLQCVGTTLYCTYSDFGSSPAYRVATWNCASWSQVASVSTGSSYANAPSSAVIDGVLYVLVDNDNTSLQLYKLSGASLSAVGATLPVGYATEAKIGIVGGKLAVVCGDVGAGFKDKTGENVYVLSSAAPTSTTAWTKAYSESSNVARNLAVAEAGTSMLAFVAYDSDSGVTPQVRVAASDGTVTSHEFAAAGTSIADASLLVSGSYAYLTVVNGSGLATTWYSAVADLQAWTKLGSDTYSNAATGSESISSLSNGGKVYVGVVSSSYTSVALVSHDGIVPTHTVTFVNWDGSVLSTQNVVDGSAATAPASPTREGYTFIGWDKPFSSVTSDLTVTALFSKDGKKVVVKELFGEGRYDTMAAIVGEGGFATGGTVIIASGEKFPDALAASALAGALRAPIVLTEAGELTSQAKAVLASLKPSQAIIVGGTAAVSDAVAVSIAALPSKPSVGRIAGDGRAETAAAIYAQGKSSYKAAYSTSVCIIATGKNASNGADALAISPYAYATATPVFLAEDDGLLSPGTAVAIKAGGFSHVIICGGTGAVGEGVKSQLAKLGLSAAYTRLGGDSRYETARSIAQWESGNGVTDTAISAVGFKASDVAVNSGETLSFAIVGVATGANFPDALASAPLLGSKNGVLLLADPSDAAGGAAISGALKSHGSDTTTCYFIGGTAALPESIRTVVRSYIK